MLLAVKLWAVAHLLANGTLADVLLFGGFLAWAVADRISVKRRAAAEAHAVPAAPARPATTRSRSSAAWRVYAALRLLGASLADRRLAAAAERRRSRPSVSRRSRPGPALARRRAVSPHRARSTATLLNHRRCARRARRGGRTQPPYKGAAEGRRPLPSSRATRSSRRAARSRSTTTAGELEVGADARHRHRPHRLRRRRSRRARRTSPATSSSPTAALPHDELLPAADPRSWRATPRASLGAAVVAARRRRRPRRARRSASSSTARSVQSASTGRHVRSAARLIADVSEFMTLAPGDVLLAGVAPDAPRVGAGARDRGRDRRRRPARDAGRSRDARRAR